MCKGLTPSASVMIAASNIDGSGDGLLVDLRHPKPTIDAFALDDDVDRDLQHLGYVSFQVPGRLHQQCQLLE
ncbi:hypothetical protein HFO89_11040 [Rhizobium leguminosarum]|nr:hypothetical protein [Rhizobium leguminosarum]